MEDFIGRLGRYRQTVKNWWVLLILGIAFILMGIVVFRNPAETYATLAVFFGILIFVTGIAQIFIGSYAPKDTGRGWMIGSGVIEAVLGLILIFNLTVSATVLPLFIGFWLLFRSLTMIGFASDLRGAGIPGTGWTLFWAILLMLCAIAILIFPAAGAGFMVVWVGAAFMVAGVAVIFFAIYLQKQKRLLGL